MELDGRRLQLAMSREIKISDGDEVVVTGELTMFWSASHAATSPVPFWGMEFRQQHSCAAVHHHDRRRICRPLVEQQWEAVDISACDPSVAPVSRRNVAVCTRSLLPMEALLGRL